MTAGWDPPNQAGVELRDTVPVWQVRGPGFKSQQVVGVDSQS